MRFEASETSQYSWEQLDSTNDFLLRVNEALMGAVAQQQLLDEYGEHFWNVNNKYVWFKNFRVN